MSTRWPAQVKRTAVTVEEGNGCPSGVVAAKSPVLDTLGTHARAFRAYDRLGEEVGASGSDPPEGGTAFAAGVARQPPVSPL